MDDIDIKSSHGAQIHIGDGGANDGVKASLTKGTTNSQIIISRKVHGASGNGKTVAAVASGNNTALSVSVSANAITITLETDGSAASVSSVNDVIAKLYANATFQEYWDASDGVGDGTGVLAAFSSDVTASGTDGTQVFDGINGIHNGPNGPGFEPQIQEATHHGTADTIRRLSRVNKTAVTFDVYFDPANVEHALLLANARAGTKTDFRQYLNDGTGDGYAYSAYISMSPSAPVDGFNVYSTTLNIDGEVADI